MNRIFIFIFFCTTTIVAAQPTDNPIASFYNKDLGYPAWTDGIKWNNAYNMATYDYSACATCAGNDFEKFKYVRDIAYSAGGGVLYYPGGTYTFDISDSPNSEGLMLKKGVVIRGENPATSDATAVLPNSDISTLSLTGHGLQNLPTKFKFTTTRLANDTLEQGISKMWNCIGIKKGSNETGLEKVEKVGIAWVEIEYGYIFFGFDATAWATSYATAAYNWCDPREPWKSGRTPDGTHPMDWFAGNSSWNGTTTMKMGKERFVFGVHIKQGGVPNYVLAHGLNPPAPAAPTFYTEANPWWFGAKISVYGSSVLVANNVISKPTKCFKMKLTVGKKKVGEGGSLAIGTVVTVPYDFGIGLSVDVNKCFVGGFKNNADVDDSSSQYTPNVQILDNWVFNHSSKGFDVAGGWMVVRNNINRRQPLDFVDIYGLGLTSFYGISSTSGRVWTSKWNDDFLCRAFTVSSRNAWYHQNQWHNTGSAFDNSSEGILHQDHLNGSECYSAALTYNKGNSYTGVWNSYAIGFFLGWNKVGSDIMQQGTEYSAALSSVEHRDLISNALYKFGTLASAKSFDCSLTNPQPESPIIEVKDTADFVKITWTDVSNEAAYRVEKKKIDSPEWTTIAYRPRQEVGGVVTMGSTISRPSGAGSQGWDGKVRNLNPAEWRDYMKSNGTFMYRVVPVTCGDNNLATSDSVAVVISSSNNLKSNKIQLSLFPNPASDFIRVSSEELNGREIKIMNLQGKEVLNLGKASNNEMQISTKALNSGLYLLQIQGKSGFGLKRFVVE